MKNILLIFTILIFTGLFTISAQAQQLSGEWKLASISQGGKNVPLVNGPRAVTIKFDNGGVAGSGGCNAYGGSFQANDSRIKIGPVRSTKMACVQEGVGAQESLYFDILEKATKYTLASDKLTLMAGSSLLTFKPALAPPDHTDRTDDQPNMEKKMLWIVDKAMVSCGDGSDKKCFQVKPTDIADWQIIPGKIEGFQYVPGKYNLIWVQQITEGNPDNDHHTDHLKLIRVVSRTRLMPHVD